MRRHHSSKRTEDSSTRLNAETGESRGAPHRRTIPSCASLLQSVNRRKVEKRGKGAVREIGENGWVDKTRATFSSRSSVARDALPTENSKAAAGAKAASGETMLVGKELSLLTRCARFVWLTALLAGGCGGGGGAPDAGPDAGGTRRRRPSTLGSTSPPPTASNEST